MKLLLAATISLLCSLAQPESEPRGVSPRAEPPAAAEPAHAQPPPATDAPALPDPALPVLVLRAREPADFLVVTGVDLDGVRVKGASGQSTEKPFVLGWDRVSLVRGQFADEAAKFRDTADLAWRARTRLDRGDAVNAEPIFEALAQTYAGRRGPTAAAASEGLLRCRLLRGVQTSAIGPWLAWIEATDAEETSQARDGDAVAFVDGATLLVPSLPPVWLNTSAVQAFARSELFPAATAAEDSKGRTLGALYQAAARFEAGLPVGAIPAPGEDDGLRLVHQVVLARAGDDAQRREARDWLATRVRRRSAPWIEAWCRVGIGRSLLREKEAEEQLLGVAELLGLPARLQRVNPYLTGVALAESAVVLLRNGDETGAARLRAELVDMFPGHPALEWEPIRALLPARASAAIAGQPPTANENAAGAPPSDNKGGPP